MRYLLILLTFLFLKGNIQAQACTVNISNPTPTVCSGTSVTLTASGATTYSWSTGATTSSIVVSPTTTTGYTVTGVAGTCTQVVSTTVTVLALPNVAIAPSTATMCFGGSIVLTGSGASTYTWSTGATTSTISATPSVTSVYTLTGTGSNGCVKTATRTVTVNPNLILTNATPSICIGSSAALVASGATTYSWNTGATTASISVSPTVTTSYTVTGTSGSCSKTLTTTVYPAAIPNVTVSTTSSTVCAGNSATLTASGATTYSWSTGPTTTTIAVTPTATTTYTLRGTTNGCAKTVSITITRIALPTVVISPTSPTICSGNAIVLTASGASTYTWNTGPTTNTISVTPTVNTTYTATGTATTGCVNTAVKTVTVVANPTVTITNPTPTTCAGTPVLLTGNGATNYTWTPGSATTPTISVSPTVTTNYTLTGRTSGCSKTATTSITVTALPNVTIAPTSPTVCAGNAITLTASGASTYSWLTGPTTATISVSPLTNTSYSVIGTATTGCYKMVAKTVTVSNQLSVNNPTPTICFGQSATLTASGSSTYSWSVGGTGTSVVVSPPAATTFTVRGTTGSCVRTLSINVTVNPLPVISLTNSNPTVCSGGSSTLSASGANSYFWSTSATTSSIIVTPASTTNYSVTGTSTLGCSKTETTSVVVGPLNVTITNPTPSICVGSSATLTANGATSYTWSNAATTTSIVVNPTVTTNYTLTGTTGSCTSTNSTVLTVVVIPTVQIAASSPTACVAGSVTLTASGANSYTWNTSATTTAIVVNPVVTTTYSVIGSNGCTSTASVIITVVPSPTVNISASSLTVCSGASSTLTASGASTYLWSNSSNSNTIVVSPVVTSTYAVTGYSNGCSALQTITINVSSLTANAGSDVAFVVGNTLTIGGSPSATGGVSPYTYAWTPTVSFVAPSTTASPNPSVSPAGTIIYQLTVTDANGCTSTDNIVLTTTVSSSINTYIDLKKQLDGSFYQVQNGYLFFNYSEEYRSYSALSYKIYDSKRIVRASTSSFTLPVVLGDNRCVLVLASGALGFTASDNNKFFTLEVTTQNNETLFLKFKYAQ